MLTIPDSWQPLLLATVKDFIEDRKSNLNAEIFVRYPVLEVEVRNMHIPQVDDKDQLVWSGNDSGNLSFKDAFWFNRSASCTLSWPKLISNACIPLPTPFWSGACSITESLLMKC